MASNRLLDVIRLVISFDMPPIIWYTMCMRGGHMQEILHRKGFRVFGEVLPKDVEKGEHNYLLTLHYDDKLIIKIGTTKNMMRRLYELLGEYKIDITICWVSPNYSKATTISAEDKNREIFKQCPGWEWIKQDRFVIPHNTSEITFRVRKDYRIPIIRYS